MMDLWRLPTALPVGGREYPIHADFRDILEIFSYFQDETLPEFIRWEIGLTLFYEGAIPEEHRQEAMEQMSRFLRCGVREKAGPRLIDWQSDAPMIVAEINRVAGQEVRAMPFVHWWTFLSWVHAIGQGQLATVVAIRDKLRRGKKLDEGERAFYRQNKSLVQLPKQYTAEELAQQQRLLDLLDGKNHHVT